MKNPKTSRLTKNDKFVGFMRVTTEYLTTDGIGWQFKRCVYA